MGDTIAAPGQRTRRLGEGAVMRHPPPLLDACTNMSHSHGAATVTSGAGDGGTVHDCGAVGGAATAAAAGWPAAVTSELAPAALPLPAAPPATAAAVDRLIDSGAAAPASACSRSMSEPPGGSCRLSWQPACSSSVRLVGGGEGAAAGDAAATAASLEGRVGGGAAGADGGCSPAAAGHAWSTCRCLRGQWRRPVSAHRSSSALQAARAGCAHML